MDRTTGDLEALRQSNTGRSKSEAYDNEEYAKEEGEYDLEAQSAAQSTIGKSLTRLDTAAWVTKHPSRIPDDGTPTPLPKPLVCYLVVGRLMVCSDAEERIDVYCRVRGTGRSVKSVELAIEKAHFSHSVVESDDICGDVCFVCIQCCYSRRFRRIQHFN